MLCYVSRELTMQKHFAGETRGCKLIEFSQAICYRAIYYITLTFLLKLLSTCKPSETQPVPNFVASP